MRVIVAHPFQQHSFKTAIAVKESGNLYKYITTVYLKKNSITSVLSCFLRGDNKRRVLSRKTADLEDDEIVLISEWANLVLLLIQRFDRGRKVYDWWYKRTLSIFNNALYRYVKKNKIDVAIVYDTVSYGFIEKVKRTGLKTKIIVDMSAPNANYMKTVYEEEAKSIPQYAQEDLKELSEGYFLNKCKAANIELKYADAFLVASNFTKKSLEWSGIDEGVIHKCVYGVYENSKENSIFQKDNRIIKCCFIGKVCMQKGAYRLFNIIDSLDRDDMEFHFFGSYSKGKLYYEKYKKKCIFHGHIPHEKMLEELKKMDVVIFPSFADGFGFSVTEGLLHNNIAICSLNAGVSELIIPGVNGYVYPPNDEETLLKILQKIDKAKLKEMQESTIETLQTYTWRAYGACVEKAIKQVCGE